MAPRTITNPAPKTESAREARKAFFCELCQKGYARQNEFAAHESSYEHNHNQRRKDLRAMNNIMSSSTSRSKEDKGDGGIIKINPISLGGKKEGGGFKKGGFKSAFGSVDDAPAEVKTVVQTEAANVKPAEGAGSDDDYDYEVYDPRKPTGCGPNCRAGP